MNHRMKSLVLVLGTMAILALISAVPCQAQIKFGYVRPDYILSKYEPFQDAMKQLDTYEKTETAKLQQRADAFQKKVEAAQKSFALMKEDQQKITSDNLEKERNDLEKSSEDLYNRDTGLLAKKHAELAQPIFDRLNRRMRKETLIFISHRFCTIKDAERNIVMHKGKIIEDGTHVQLMDMGGKYAQLYTIQVQRFLRD